MKKITGLFLLLLLIVVSVTYTHAQEDEGGYKIDRVVLDAGHGGKDPGAIGYTGSKEKHIALAVTLQVGKYINEYLPDVEVIYTRDKDVFIPLYERGKIANQSKADLFISIHADAFDKSSVYGTEVFVLGLHKSDAAMEVAMRENQAILKEENYEENYGGFDPNSPESYIILNMKINAHLEESVEFASLVETQFVQRANRRSRGVKQAGFVVLHQTNMPSVLIEIGFISNKNEEAYLMSKQGQEYIASAIYRAFKEYKLDKESGPAIPEGRSTGGEIADNPPANTPGDIEDRREVVETSPQPRTNLTGVTYKVQILASKQLLKAGDPLLKGVKEYEIEQSASGYNRYICGSFPTYKATLDLQYKLKQMGHKDAYIVAYHKGERISVKKALEITGED